ARTIGSVPGSSPRCPRRRSGSGQGRAGGGRPGPRATPRPPRGGPGRGRANGRTWPRRGPEPSQPFVDVLRACCVRAFGGHGGGWLPAVGRLAGRDAAGPPLLDPSELPIGDG